MTVVTECVFVGHALCSLPRFSILCHRDNQAMRTDLYLPPEVWHGHVLKHTVNDVYHLQRLRAVNKGFRETID